MHNKAASKNKGRGTTTFPKNIWENKIQFLNVLQVFCGSRRKYHLI
jgi:hypothetical protein